MEFVFKARLVVCNYRIPNRRVFLDLIAVVRPTDNTLVNIVCAVFCVAVPACDPVCAFHIDRCKTDSRVITCAFVSTYVREPLIASIGIGVSRRANQAENCCFCLVRLIRILVLHNFNALGCRSLGVIRIGDRKRNGCRALAFAGHNAVPIYAKNLLVVAGPLTGVAFSTSLLNDLVCKLNRLELSYRISTVDRHFRHLGEIGHCDFNGFGNTRSIGSFVRTCSSRCVLRRYREGDLNRSFTGRFHTCNRCLGCIARNWCNCCLGVITGFPIAGIALRIFRQNFGRKVNCFALRHACRCNFLVINHELSICRRNRSGHRDRQFSRDFAVIVVRNSKFHGCFAHALGGDCAIFCHRQNITVIYAPSAAFVCCVGRVDDHSFQLALRMLGKRERGGGRRLTFDSDRSIGDLCDYLDFDGFGFFISLKTIIIAVVVV